MPDRTATPAHDATFDHASTFSAATPTGNVRLGALEACYEELFAEVIEDGIITPDERARLDKMADNLGLDRLRLRKLEEALQAAYEARHHVVIRDLSDDAPPAATISPFEPATDTRTLALQRRVAFLEQRVAELERALTEARAQVAVEVDLSGLGAAPAAHAIDDDPAELSRRLRHDPRDEAQLHALHRLLARRGDDDGAACVAQVLDYLGAADAAEKARAVASAPEGLIRPRAALTPEAWTRLLFHPEEEPLVGEIFGVVVSAVLMGRLSALRRDKALPKLDPSAKQDPQTTTVQAVRAFAWAAAILGMAAPPLYVDPDADLTVEVVPAVPPAARLGHRALSGRSAQELAFVAGRHLTMHREEHFVKLLFPQVEGLEDIFLAALSIGNPGLPLSAAVRERVVPISKAIEPLLEPPAIDRLRGHFLRFVEEGGRTNLQRWSQAVERTAARAGLLLAGDLRAAEAMMALEPPAPGDPSVTTRMNDLLAFVLSERYAKLRRQLGIARPQAS